jgi:hypothetical protein
VADFEKLDDGTFRVNVGYCTVHLCKLYGPMIFADLTIKAVNEGDDAYWIVYRDDKEWCRIPAQMDGDFEDDIEPE